MKGDDVLSLLGLISEMIEVEVFDLDWIGSGREFTPVNPFSCGYVLDVQINMKDKQNDNRNPGSNHDNDSDD